MRVTVVHVIQTLPKDQPHRLSCVSVVCFVLHYRVITRAQKSQSFLSVLLWVWGGRHRLRLLTEWCCSGKRVLAWLYSCMVCAEGTWMCGSGKDAHFHPYRPFRHVYTWKCLLYLMQMAVPNVALRNWQYIEDMHYFCWCLSIIHDCWCGKLSVIKAYNMFVCVCGSAINTTEWNTTVTCW